MPQPYEQAVLTTQGEKLLAKVAAGRGQIEYVCMVTGNGIYSEEEKKRAALKEQINLKSEKNRYAFAAVNLEDKVVRLTALLTNQDPLTFAELVTEGYYINEVGIYAKEKGTDNNTAILYSMCVTASSTGLGDYMPEYNGRNRSEITQDYILSVDDTVEISVNMIGSVALAADLDQLKKNMNQLSLDQQAAIDEAYRQATGYTDLQIADLINGAPETLDTLGEIAKAMGENADVVQALEQAIGSKASEADFSGHVGNATIHTTASERQAYNGAVALLNAITAGGAITEVKIVNALPADAANHPTTFYWIRG